MKKRSSVDKKTLRKDAATLAAVTAAAFIMALNTKTFCKHGRAVPRRHNGADDTDTARRAGACGIYAAFQRGEYFAQRFSRVHRL